MTWRHILLALALILVVRTTGAWADDSAVKPFLGHWHGTEVKSSGGDGLALKPSDLDIRVSADNDGFRLIGTGFARDKDGRLSREKVEAAFSPTKRPGVYAFSAGEKSLLGRLFADPATGNPLKGETLLWARIEGMTLTVYSLAINPNGGFDLDRYARTLTDHGMTIRYTRRVENDQILTIEGRADAAGG